MSFSISLSGHSAEPHHNDAVKVVFEQAVRSLRALPETTVQGQLSSSDQSGAVLVLTDADVNGEEAALPGPTTETTTDTEEAEGA